MSEIRGLIKKIESKIEDLEREKSRLQDDLKVVNKAEKIRQRLDGQGDGAGEEHQDSDGEDKDQEYDRLKEQMNPPEKQQPHASW